MGSQNILSGKKVLLKFAVVFLAVEIGCLVNKITALTYPIFILKIILMVKRLEMTLRRWYLSCSEQHNLVRYNSINS